MNTLKTLTAAAALMLVAGTAQAESCASMANDTELTQHCLEATYDCVEHAVQAAAAFHVNVTSDIDVMERCKVATYWQVRAALAHVMEVSVNQHIGPTPFIAAHCMQTQDPTGTVRVLEYEYKGVTQEMTISLDNYALWRNKPPNRGVQ